VHIYCCNAKIYRKRNINRCNNKQKNHHQHYTAPEMIRGKPRDFAKLRQSLGYLRYLFISRIVRPISEHLFFSASNSLVLCHEEHRTDTVRKTFGAIISIFQSIWHK
jgi:hypothetical protein